MPENACYSVSPLFRWGRDTRYTIHDTRYTLSRYTPLQRREDASKKLCPKTHVTQCRRFVGVITFSHDLEHGLGRGKRRKGVTAGRFIGVIIFCRGSVFALCSAFELSQNQTSLVGPWFICRGGVRTTAKNRCDI